MVLHSNLLEPHLVALLLYNKVEGRYMMEEGRGKKESAVNNYAWVLPDWEKSSTFAIRLWK